MEFVVNIEPNHMKEKWKYMIIPNLEWIDHQVVVIKLLVSIDYTRDVHKKAGS